MSRSKGFHLAVQYLLLLIITLLIWQVFYPALMSSDSITQYTQARTGKFDNWHPPLMAIVLSGIMRLGGDIGSLMLLQCLAGLFGLRAFILLAIEMTGSHLSAVPRQWMATSAVLLFLLPITPLTFYLMTFWKDSWLAIIFLWGGAYLIWLFLRQDKLTESRFYYHVVGLALLWSLSYSIRHNALVVIPAVCLCMCTIIRLRRGRMDAVAVGVALLPLCLTAFIGFGLKWVFDVQDARITSLQKAFDLVSACVVEKESCSNFPYTAVNLEPNYKEGFIYGDVWPLLWGDKLIVKPGYIKLDGNNPEIDSEYRHLFLRHTGLWFKVKALSFAALLDPRDAPKAWYYSHLDPNLFGLRLNDRFAGVRRALFGVAWRIWHHWLLRWISGVHLVWLLTCLIFMATGLPRLRFHSDKKAQFCIPLLCVPLFYYSGYMLAVPATDFRMMYPATQFVQVIAFSIMVRLSYLIIPSLKAKGF